MFLRCDLGELGHAHAAGTVLRCDVAELDRALLDVGGEGTGSGQQADDDNRNRQQVPERGVQGGLLWESSGWVNGAVSGHNQALQGRLQRMARGQAQRTRGLIDV